MLCEIAENYRVSLLLLSEIDMKTIRVSAAVIIDGSRILATERGYGEYKGGWEFPGGKREEGESGEDTVIREIKEELGADIAVDRFLCTVEYQYEAFLLCLSCRVRNDNNYRAYRNEMA